MAGPWEKYQAQSGPPAGAMTHDGFPARNNPDGSYSTELSITVTDPRLNSGRPTNIPSLWRGQEVDQDTAIDNAVASGKPYQAFNSIQQAVTAAQARSAAGGAGAEQGPWSRYQPQSREDRRAALVASNPAEYDPQSPEYQAKYGTGGFGGVARDVGRAAVRAPLTVADTVLTVGRNAVAAPVAGLAGALTAPLGFLPGRQGVGARNVERVQSFIAGQPLTEGGEAVSGAIAYPFEKLAEGADKAGDFTARKTGSPLLGTMVNTAIQGAPALLLRGRGKSGRTGSDRVGSAVPEGDGATRPKVPATAERPAGLAKVREAAPTKEELRTASQQAYQRATDAGVVVNDSGISNLKQSIQKAIAEDYDTDLHPHVKAIMKRVEATEGSLTLDQLEKLRRFASKQENTARRIQGGEDSARIAGNIVDEIDDFTDARMQQFTASGDAVAGAEALTDARNLYSRNRKAQELDDLLASAKERAGQFSVSGMENAIRTEFRQLARNKKRMARFTKPEQAAIQQISRGTNTVNALRWLGKLAPTGQFSQLGWLGAAYATGGAAAVLPAAGLVARGTAGRMQLNAANSLSEMVRRGGENAAPLVRKPTTEPVQ